MNLADTATLLAHAKIIDNREVNELMIAEWYAILEPVTPEISLDDAIESLRAFRRASSAWVTPEIILTGTKALRAERDTIRTRELARQVRALRSDDDKARMGGSQNNLSGLVANWDDPDAFHTSLNQYNDRNKEWFGLEPIQLAPSNLPPVRLQLGTGKTDANSWMNR